MTNYQSSDIHMYLADMYRYLSGDLVEFHKLCKLAEIKEQAIDSVYSRGSMYRESSGTLTRISETTKYPGNVQAPVNPNSKKDIFRLTIPVTLSLFATIDCVGFLSGTNNNPSNTNENFRQFFRQSNIPVTDNDSDFINRIYRQGLTHVYFPKLGLGIAYHSNNPLGRLIFRDTDGFLILNINRLEEIVISTFEKIKNDEQLYAEMEKKYQSLISKYQTDHNGAIASYVT